MRVDRIRFGDDRFTEAKRWEHAIFGRENSYTTAADDVAEEMLHYRRWERSSEFYVGFDVAAERPVAVLRALRNDSRLGIDSFSTISDTRAFPTGSGRYENLMFPEWNRRFEAIAPDAIAELATQAVRRAHRRAGVIEQVWERFAGCLTDEGVRFIAVALVVPLFEWYQLLFDEAIAQIGMLLPDYVGADSIPAVIDLHRLDTRFYRERK